MKTTINGKPCEFDPRAEESAVDIIREHEHLTGTKLVCGAGICGACTVLVDGIPMTSCMMPAHSMEGKNIQTIEAHGPENLHPMQKAFMAHDGLQCGFCTPGFLNEAIAYYNQRRKTHGKEVPSKEAIALAMSGHLCRCGAYIGIYEAIQRAIAGDYDEVKHIEYPRVEAIEKVTGRAKYTADIHLPRMLTGRILGSEHAFAKVLRVDTAVAEEMEGVNAVVDILKDKNRIVRFVGQPIVAIAAVNEDIAHHALQKIKVEYEVYPHVIDMEDAMKPGAPVVYQHGHGNLPNASEGPIPPAHWDGNIRTPFINATFSRKPKRARKIVKKAASDDDLVLVKRTYKTPGQTHTALEPHCAVADWTAEGLTVYASTQTSTGLANEIAHHYKLNINKLVVHSEFVGGAFGAKQGMTFEIEAAIDLSRAAKAPVKVWLERLEEMVLGGYRPIVKAEFAAVADKEGNLSAMVGDFYGNGGVAVQSQCAPWIRYTYVNAAKDANDHDVITNTSFAKPFRGPSGPAAFWVMESAVHLNGCVVKSTRDPVHDLPGLR